MPAEQLGRSGGARLDSECQELCQGPQGASVAAGRRWRRTQEQRRAVRAALGAAMATEAEQRAEVLSVDEYRQLHSITLAVIGESQPPAGEHEPDDSEDEPPADGTERWQPVQRFADAPFHAKLLQELRHASFRNPTPIQAQCWPIANDGRDVVAIAKTGSGKTLGYLLPIFHRALTREAQMVAARDARSPFAIVLAPTRELVLQIHEQAAQFGHSAGVTSTCVYGGAGAPRHSQLPQLLAGPQVRRTDSLRSRFSTYTALISPPAGGHRHPWPAGGFHDGAGLSGTPKARAARRGHTDFRAR